MKHILYIDSQEHSTNSERDLTHAVIGQRDEPAERAAAGIDALQKRPTTTWTPEERVALHTFVHAASDGRYKMRVLDWATSAEQAEAHKADFTAPEWINVQVVPVTRKLQYV